MKRSYTRHPITHASKALALATRCVGHGCHQLRQPLRDCCHRYLCEHHHMLSCQIERQRMMTAIDGTRDESEPGGDDSIAWYEYKSEQEEERTSA